MSKSNGISIKQWFFTLLMVILTLELSPYLLGRFFLNHSFSRKEIREELRKVEIPKEKNDSTDLNGDAGYLSDHILHPYLGFVSIPHPDYNEFNLPGINPITKRSTNTVNVVIMGGSVAKDIYTYSGERIKQNLKKSRAFADKEINLIVFALGGFKQPQPLIALNYFLALGAEYDIVINIDGFNEIVLPYADNLPNHVFPSYPRHWNIYSRKKLDSKVMLLMGKQAVITENMNHSKSVMASSVWRYSNIALFIWKVIDNKRKGEYTGLESKLRIAIKNSEQDYQSTGIYTSVVDTLNFFKEQVSFWSRCSEQIAHIGKSSGFEYFHFLQPNQYVEDSKKLTKEELKIAYEKGPFSYKDAAIIGYPLLIKEGRQLIQNGIKFIDLTMMFKNESRTVYNDKCCHFNQLGYNLIADRISQELISGTKLSETRTN
jgi:hypothetical protein